LGTIEVTPWWTPSFIPAFPLFFPPSGLQVGRTSEPGLQAIVECESSPSSPQGFFFPFSPFPNCEDVAHRGNPRPGSPRPPPPPPLLPDFQSAQGGTRGLGLEKAILALPFLPSPPPSQKNEGGVPGIRFPFLLPNVRTISSGGARPGPGGAVGCFFPLFFPPHLLDQAIRSHNVRGRHKWRVSPPFFFPPLFFFFPFPSRSLGSCGHLTSPPSCGGKSRLVVSPFLSLFFFPGGHLECGQNNTAQPLAYLLDVLPPSFFRRVPWGIR